jgi:uncharacterized membrane protein YfcA
VWKPLLAAHFFLDKAGATFLLMCVALLALLALLPGAAYTAMSLQAWNLLPAPVLLSAHQAAIRSSQSGSIGMQCTLPTISAAFAPGAGECFPYVCEDGVCRECRDDSECRGLGGSEAACVRLSEKQRVCAHKQLLPPDARDYHVILLAILFCSVAAGGGIGGGGLIIPLLVLVGNFTPQGASPLASATVFGGSLSNLAHYRRQRHPSGRGPLISFETAAMMEPLTLAGATVGVLLNKVFPSWLILLLLVLVLGLTTRRTLGKGLELWAKESAAERGPSPRSAPALAPVDEAGARPPPSALPLAPPLAEEDLSASSSHDALVLVASLAACTLLSLLRGPDQAHSPLDLRCGDAGYVLLLVLQLALLLGVAVYVRSTVLRRHARRKSAGYTFLDDGVLWSPRSTLVYPLLCSVAGLCAGLFGIGGGVVKAPLMIELGLLPQVASATSAYMIFFTSASATLQFAMLGELRAGYACALFAAGLLGTAVGQHVVSALVRRSGRASLIVLIIALVIGGSTVVMSVAGLLDVLSELADGRSQGFQPLCS